MTVSTPPGPLESADSTVVGAGLIFRNGETLSALTLRPAFRSILDQEGKTTWTELKVLEVKALARSWDRSELGSVRLLSMQNSQAIDQYFQPLSWGLDIGAQKTLFLENQKIAPNANVDIGYSLDFDDAHLHRLSGMVEVGLEVDSQRPVGGFMCRLVQKWHPLLRTSLESHWNWGSSFRSEVQSFQSAFDLTRSWILRAGWDQHKKYDQQQNIYIEPALGLEYHLLL